MLYFRGLKILIQNDRRMTHPPEREDDLCSNIKHLFYLLVLYIAWECIPF